MNLTTSSNGYVTSRDGMYTLVQDTYNHCFLNNIFDFKTYNILPIINKIKKRFKSLEENIIINKEDTQNIVVMVKKEYFTLTIELMCEMITKLTPKDKDLFISSFIKNLDVFDLEEEDLAIIELLYQYKLSLSKNFVIDVNTDDSTFESRVLFFSCYLKQDIELEEANFIINFVGNDSKFISHIGHNLKALPTILNKSFTFIGDENFKWLADMKEIYKILKENIYEVNLIKTQYRTLIPEIINSSKENIRDWYEGMSLLIQDVFDEYTCGLEEIENSNDSFELFISKHNEKHLDMLTCLDNNLKGVDLLKCNSEILFRCATTYAKFINSDRPYDNIMSSLLNAVLSNFSSILNNEGAEIILTLFRTNPSFKHSLTSLPSKPSFNWQIKSDDFARILAHLLFKSTSLPGFSPHKLFEGISESAFMEETNLILNAMPPNDRIKMFSERNFSINEIGWISIMEALTELELNTLINFATPEVIQKINKDSSEVKTTRVTDVYYPNFKYVVENLNIKSYFTSNFYYKLYTKVKETNIFEINNEGIYKLAINLRDTLEYSLDLEKCFNTFLQTERVSYYISSVGVMQSLNLFNENHRNYLLKNRNILKDFIVNDSARVSINFYDIRQFILIILNYPELNELGNDLELVLITEVLPKNNHLKYNPLTERGKTLMKYMLG